MTRSVKPLILLPMVFDKVAKKAVNSGESTVPALQEFGVCLSLFAEGLLGFQHQAIRVSNQGLPRNRHLIATQ
jgi:hypothetical protein